VSPFRGEYIIHIIYLFPSADNNYREKKFRRWVMFYLLLRLLHEEMSDGKISREEYMKAVSKVASVHGIRKNGIQ
jgi:hypothetical protein